MLTPDYLDGLPEAIIEIFHGIEDFMIGDIARRIKKMGTATSTAEIQRVVLQAMGKNTKVINQKIADALGVTQKEVERMFAQSEQIVTDNQAQIFEAVGIKQDTGFAMRIGEAAAKSAMGDLSNITRTMGYPTNNGQFTIWTDAYRQALGFAQMQVATGAIDYNTAIRQAIKPFTARGLCSVNYASGRVVSIEAAARQCIIGGVSDMASAISEKNAKDFGADGWEITAHANCAPDHEAVQGRQYANKEYEALNSLLARPIGTLGCRHSAYPIIMGISGRAYSDERLTELKRKNKDGVTYEGRHYTGYEAAQMQRQCERAIRKTKRELIEFDELGLKKDFTAASIKLRRQREYYEDFSNKAGLLRQNERAQVSGYGRSLRGKVLYAEKKALKALEIQRRNGIIIAEVKATGIKGEIHLEPKLIAIDTLDFDDKHINRVRGHNVTNAEAVQFIKDAKISVTKWNGRFENYYGSEGCTYVDKETGSIRTSFKKEEFDSSVKVLMEVLKKYGK